MQYRQLAQTKKQYSTVPDNTGMSPLDKDNKIDTDVCRQWKANTL